MTAGSIGEYGAANTKPTANADELELWWHRDTTSIRYYPYKVKKVGERKVGDLKYLQFKLARNETLKKVTGEEATFEAEVTQQYLYCWPDLPSTAPLATEALPYGFLMLSKDWEAEANDELSTGFDVSTLREGGTKWPLSASSDDKSRWLAPPKDAPSESTPFHVYEGLIPSIR